jgi:archaellum component FlaF (FlaF/FlaG flagellin family)
VHVGRSILGVAFAVLTACGSAGSGSSGPAATSSAKTPVRTLTSRPVDGSARERAHTSAISDSTFGDFGVGDSYSPMLSADGRFVAFVSTTDDLVAGDTNARDDVFVRDTKTGLTSRVNVSNTGAQGNGIRLIPPSVSIDAAGRYVAFQTDDTNLVPGGANNCIVVEPGIQPCPGIYVRDLQSQTTRLVNVSDSGVHANGFSQFPTISSDGRYVAFLSGASNLVPGDTNNATDVFVADLKTSTIRRVSVSSTGGQADADSYSISMSRNGRYVAFNSAATGLAPGKPDKTVIGVFFRDLQTGKTQLVGLYGKPVQDNFGYASISPNGRYVEFDSNSAPDELIRDMQTGTVLSTSELTGVKGSGVAGGVAFDATERYVAFGFLPTGSSSRNDPGQLLVRDFVTGTTQVVSLSDAGSQVSTSDMAISADGRYVAFSSNSPKLSTEGFLPGTEIFLRGPLH